MVSLGRKVFILYHVGDKCALISNLSSGSSNDSFQCTFRVGVQVCGIPGAMGHTPGAKVSVDRQPG